MKQQQYPAVPAGGKAGKASIRLVSQIVNGKKHSKPDNMDSFLSLRINEKKFKEIVRDSVRSVLVEDFGIISSEVKSQACKRTPIANEPSPVLLLNYYRPLTAKEVEVMELVLLTFPNRKIGARLKMSLNTVKNHMKNINSKLGVKDRVEACKIYVQLYKKQELPA
jgi:DNA-binding NarL/FixJ family response regulator